MSAQPVSRVVLATRNDHKVGELRAILADVCEELGLEIVGASEFEGAPDVVEGDTRHAADLSPAE